MPACAQMAWREGVWGVGWWWWWWRRVGGREGEGGGGGRWEEGGGQEGYNHLLAREDAALGAQALEDAALLGLLLVELGDPPPQPVQVARRKDERFGRVVGQHAHRALLGPLGRDQVQYLAPGRGEAGEGVGGTKERR